MRNQYLSRLDVQEYLMMYPDATNEEKRALLAWIKDESDRPLDFIGAIRVEREYCEEQWRLRQGCAQ